MSLTNPPAVITQLSAQILALTSLPSGATTWYPEKTNSTSPPFIVLSEESRRLSPYAAGAGGIAGGVLMAVLHIVDTIGNAEAAARLMLDELLAQQSGIVFNGGECGLSAEPTPGEIAGGASLVAIAMSLPWGLNV